MLPINTFSGTAHYIYNESLHGDCLTIKACKAVFKVPFEWGHIVSNLSVQPSATKRLIFTAVTVIE